MPGEILGQTGRIFRHSCHSGHIPQLLRGQGSRSPAICRQPVPGSCGEWPVKVYSVWQGGMEGRDPDTVRG